MPLTIVQRLYKSVCKHQISDNQDGDAYDKSCKFISQSVLDLVNAHRNFMEHMYEAFDDDTQVITNEMLKEKHEREITSFALCLRELDKKISALEKITAKFPIDSRLHLNLKISQMKELMQPIKENPLICEAYEQPYNPPAVIREKNKTSKSRTAVVLGAVSVGTGLIGAGTAGLLSGTLISTVGIAMGTGMGIGLAGGPLGVIAGAVIGAVAGLLLAGGIAYLTQSKSQCFFNHRKSNDKAIQTDKHSIQQHNPR